MNQGSRNTGWSSWAGHTAVLHNNNLIVWGGYADGATNTINLFNINTK